MKDIKLAMNIKMVKDSQTNSEEFCGNKHQRNPKGQSRMDNPQTRVVLGNTNRYRMKTNKRKKHNTEN